jgi:hypothetical protein
MAKLMFNIHTSGPAPTLDQVRDQFGLADGDLDAAFGVIEVDRGVYTVLVEDRVASKVQSTTDWRIEGPFGDLQVEPTDLDSD